MTVNLRNSGHSVSMEPHVHPKERISTDDDRKAIFHMAACLRRYERSFYDEIAAASYPSPKTHAFALRSASSTQMTVNGIDDIAWHNDSGYSEQACARGSFFFS